MEDDTPIYNSLAHEYNQAWEERFPGEWPFFFIPCIHGLSAWLCTGPGHYPPDVPDYF